MSFNVHFSFIQKKPKTVFVFLLIRIVENSKLDLSKHLASSSRFAVRILDVGAVHQCLSNRSSLSLFVT